jgi:hypothetical protein
MSLQSLIVARAIAHSGLNALIAGRIYPDARDRDAVPPYVVYSRASTDQHITFGASPASLIIDRVQMDCFAETKAGLIALEGQVRSAFDRWAPDADGHSKIERRADIVEMLDTEGELYGVSMDFLMSHHQG